MKESTSASRWAVVRDKLEQGDMPPDGEPQPDPEASARVLAWIKAEMKRSRRNFTQRLQQISGNKVQHDLLFDPNQAARLMIAPRIRRHSVELYETFRGNRRKVLRIWWAIRLRPIHDSYLTWARRMDVPTTSQLIRNAVTILERLPGTRWRKATSSR